MLEFPLGVACGAKKFLYVMQQVSCSSYVWLFLIKKLEFPLGVACGTKKVFVCYAKSDFVTLFLVLGRPQGQQVEAFWSNNYENLSA